MSALRVHPPVKMYCITSLIVTPSNSATSISVPSPPGGWITLEPRFMEREEAFLIAAGDDPSPAPGGPGYSSRLKTWLRAAITARTPPTLSRSGPAKKNTSWYSGLRGVRHARVWM